MSNTRILGGSDSPRGKEEAAKLQQEREKLFPTLTAKTIEPTGQAAPLTSNVPRPPSNAFEAALIVLTNHFWGIAQTKMGTLGVSKKALRKKSPETLKFEVIILDEGKGGKDTMLKVEIIHCKNPPKVKSNAKKA